jgi:prevent-host-death family protein
MRTVNMHQAKSQLSQLVEAVEAGEEVIIARAGRPVARLVPARTRPGGVQIGALPGLIEREASDFDAPIDEQVLMTPSGKRSKK